MKQLLLFLSLAFFLMPNSVEAQCGAGPDVTPPTAACQNITVYLNAGGIYTLDSADVDGGSMDNCIKFSLDFISGSGGAIVAAPTYSCTDIGTLQTQWVRITDTAGNSSDCFSNITVLDTVRPIMTCQTATLNLDVTGNATLDPADIDGGTFDNCGAGLVLTTNPSAFTCANLGVNTVWLIATDASGNTDSCMTTITVADTVAPMALCNAPGILVYLDATGSVTIDSSVIDNGSTDNCTSVTMALSTYTFTCDSLGVRNVSLFVTDSFGNSDTCTTTVIVTDTIAPDARCKPVTVYLDSNGGVRIDSSFVDNGSSDACSSITMTLSQDTFTCADIGPNFIWLVVSDTNGNSDSCMATVFVDDTIAPAAYCMDTTIYLDALGIFVIDSSFIDSSSFDTCGVSMSLSKSTFVCADTGVNVVELYVVDPSGNRDTCTANVTVLDTLNPIVQCVPSGTVFSLDSNGGIRITAAMIDNGSTDNCNIDTMYVSLDTFACNTLGDTAVTLYVVDVSGNIDSCTTVIEIADGISPAAICADTTVYLNALGMVVIDSSFVDSASWDNCTIVSMTIDKDTFRCADAGPNTVTLTVTDSAGNVSTCTSVVTVLDTVTPVANCFADTTIYLDAGGNVTIDATYTDSASFDSCAYTVTLSETTFTCSDTGLNVVETYVTDASGNADTCFTNVTVLDTIPPVVICNPFVTIHLDSSGNDTLTPAQLIAFSFDACPTTDSVSMQYFTCADIGVHTVTVYVTDASGNIDSCTSTVTVLDTIAPEAICKDSIVYLDATGSITIDSNALDNGSNDNCHIGSITLSQTTFSCTDTGANVVTMTVTDTSGNSTTCTATVTVLDTIAPVAMCKPAAFMSIRIDSARYKVSGAPGLGADVTAQVQDSVDVDFGAGLDSVKINLSGATIFGGAAVHPGELIVYYTDLSSGASFTLTAFEPATSFWGVGFSLNPSGISDTVYLDGSGTATITSAFIDNGSSDNCSFTDSLSKSTFDCSDTGLHDITLYITDASGNMDSCTSTIIVVDTIAPVAICKNDTVYLDSNGMVTIDSTDVDGGSFDNCSFTVTITPNTFDCDSVGQRYINYVLTDPSGNKDSCTAIITILDSVPPVAICLDTTIYLDSNGYARILPIDVNDSTYDNCNSVNVFTDTTEFYCADIGVNMVQLVAVDLSGNRDTCFAAVTILDSFPPVAICKDTTIYLDTNGMFTIDSTFIDNGSFDGCGGRLTMALSATMFDCSSVGDSLITLYVTDSSGNVDSCTATITILDTIAPKAMCMDTTVYVDQNGQFVIDSSFIIDTIIEACAYTAKISDSLLTCADIPNNPIEISLYVEDASGNRDTCTANVTVLDTLAPIARCKNATIFLDSTGNTTLFKSDIEDGSTDNCEIDTIYITKTAYTCADLGYSDVDLVVVDIYGNRDTCTAVVYVVDVIAPSVVCKDDTVYLDATGMGSISVADVMVSNFENCNDTIYLSDTLFTCADIGLNTVTLTIRDESGRSGDCQSTITVLDTLNPVVNCNDFTVYLNAIGSVSITVADVDSGSTDNCAIASRTIS
ncbi:MAG: hypothetical protein ACPGVD_01855, partial [Flavobacteriales bacterium]